MSLTHREMTFFYVTYYVISFYIYKTVGLIGTKFLFEEKVIEMIDTSHGLYLYLSCKLQSFTNNKILLKKKTTFT